MAIYLVRHAHAGSRSGWDGDDNDRPLSAKGQREVAHLVEVLAEAQIGTVLSSPALRCVQTVEPIADIHGLEVRIEPVLAEGSSIPALWDLLRAEAPNDPMLCSHGDIIPPLLDTLADLGMTADSPLRSQKGSLWVIETEGDKFTAGSYHPPGQREPA